MPVALLQVEKRGAERANACWAGGVLGGLLAPAVASSRTGQWGGSWSPSGHSLIGYPCHLRKRKTPSCLRSAIALFCWLDDCATLVEQWQRHHLLPSGRQRRRAGKLSRGQMLSILVLFHISADKDFKHFRRMASHKNTGTALALSPVRAGW